MTVDRRFANERHVNQYTVNRIAWMKRDRERLGRHYLLRHRAMEAVFRDNQDD